MFDFDKFEARADEFAKTLKLHLQTRMFNPIAPDFDVKVNVYDRGRGYGKKIAVETSNIAKHMNFNMFAAVWFHNFGGNVLADENDLYWLPINWRWEHKNGGSNGADALTLYINDDGEVVKLRED